MEVSGQLHAAVALILGKGPPIAHGTKGCVGLRAAMVISYFIISYIQLPHTKQYKFKLPILPK